MAKLSVVYGGNWGSEGKGQIVRFISDISDRPVVGVRVGGPNAGHTIHPDGPKGQAFKLQQIPCPVFVDQDNIGVLGASAVILPDVLYRELKLVQARYGANAQKLIIDRRATIITEAHMQREAADLTGRISSTGEGVGAATADKVMRVGIPWEDWLYTQIDVAGPTREQYALFTEMTETEDTVPLLSYMALSQQRHVVLEGTQGYWLSLNTSPYYPYTTSRDCGPEALMGQAGICPRSFDEVEIVCVMRSFPIRVGGPSGPLPNEISWEELRDDTDGYVDKPEITTVTGKERRIARWDWSMAMDTVLQTRPTALALTFLDYVDPAASACFTYQQLPEGAKRFVDRVEAQLHTPVEYVSVAPGVSIWNMRKQLW